MTRCSPTACLRCTTCGHWWTSARLTSRRVKAEVGSRRSPRTDSQSPRACPHRDAGGAMGPGHRPLLLCPPSPPPRPQPAGRGTAPGGAAAPVLWVRAQAVASVPNAGLALAPGPFLVQIGELARAMAAAGPDEAAEHGLGVVVHWDARCCEPPRELSKLPRGGQSRPGRSAGPAAVASRHGADRNTRPAPVARGCAQVTGHGGPATPALA